MKRIILIVNLLKALVLHAALSLQTNITLPLVSMQLQMEYLT